MSQDPSPDFGPSGYLPDRAAKRARKIVLRAPLGLQWVVASLLAGVVVLVAGVLLLTGDDTPGEPWVAVAATDDLGEVTALDDLDVVLVSVGRVRAFEDDGSGLGYCGTSRRLEAGDGRVFSLTGRGLGGADSLREHPTLVRDGVVYLDPTRTTDAPAPSPEPAEPACGTADG